MSFASFQVLSTVMDKIYFTWEEFDKAVNIIADRIKDNKYNPKMIYGIPRGGLALALSLSHKMNVPIINGLGFRSRRILVVDDVSDSGNTLMNYARDCLTATIHLRQGSKFIPDIWVYERPDNSWIVYPWENKDEEIKL